MQYAVLNANALGIGYNQNNCENPCLGRWGFFAFAMSPHFTPYLRNQQALVYWLSTIAATMCGGTNSKHRNDLGTPNEQPRLPFRHSHSQDSVGDG